MERIVVGYDGSEQSRKALARAADIANGATLAVVSAAKVERLVRDPSGGVEPIDPADAEARDNALAEARKYLEGRSINNAVYVKGTGNAADVIVQEAEESGADLIVVGTRGLSTARLALRFMGSVSTNVVHHAPCDVLVVR
jgi:nucleotide-binding universal stress UspA family protein